jgi:carbon starvation protein
LVYTGDISTIWPLFGMSNQLLASCALIIGTTMIIRMNKAKYAWITAVPGISMAAITMYAGYLQVTGVYLKPGKENYLLATLAIIIMVLMVIVFVGAFKRWSELLNIQTTTSDEYGETVVALAEE